MSVEAITWALGQNVGHSSAKFVLVALANCANPEWECWPSIAHLCDLTNQNRKTVMANLQKLCALGAIETTGETVGRTGRVQVYRLVTVPKSASLNSAENGTIDASEIVPKTDCNSPENGPKQYQKRTETVPKTGHGTVRNRKEPSGKRKARSPDGTRLPADWQPSDEQIAFLKAEQPGADPKRVADRFRDYWISVPGAKGVKLDWEATWRNWARPKEEKRANPASNPGRQSAAERNAATIAALTGRDKPPDIFGGFAERLD